MHPQEHSELRDIQENEQQLIDLISKATLEIIAT